ncbi:hypothetical protein J31TS4_10940 [Paenibacillus sp. J31TS4]|uniref:alpha/beta hydrolase family protein n=1 Tax=Paenibacillus sp. J31TS4 TaxID=2807195 RepID=UPI001B2E309D|nr:prolyl oligopeptidase family serine peptidase [Paenibacillus sp. J31TS4]GIP37814.1 hypothetical protein J31TS4_10940 [Paenibacillus sp. J31TS4]
MKTDSGTGYNLFELNRSGVPPLLAEGETREDWAARREAIRERWLAYIGGAGASAPVRYRMLSETAEPDHVRWHLRYETADGDEVTAFLLLPPGLDPEASDAQAPAMLALHPTNEAGKACVATTAAGKAGRMYGLELVRRGYVVLAPDALTAGERIYDGYESFRSGPFYERYPEWSTVGKNIADHRHGVDLLASLPFVDAGRIGAIGHSFGGYNAYFLGGIDPRIKAIVSSCGFSPFTSDLHPTHWGVRDWYTHLPKLTGDLAFGRVPFEFHEIAALAAPTPFFNYSAQSDAIFPHWKAIGDCMVELFRLYERLGVPERFQAVLGVKEHDFPPEIREMAYAFLDRWLLPAAEEKRAFEGS